MATYLERYLAGECEQVWADLMALGAQVRNESVSADALAVARETMRRARRNIELLIPRLEAIGYQFGYAWAKTAGPQAGRQPEGGWGGPFVPPPPDTSMRLRDLQMSIGELPLSILAWFEAIGEVDFVGQPPRHWGLANSDKAGSDEADEGREAVAGFAGRSWPVDEDPALEWCSLDPLCIWPLDAVMAAASPPASEPDPADPESDKWYLPLTPYPEGKYFISGGGSIGILVPNATADAEFVDLLPFVEYLRVCFHWGGFPGLRNYLGPMDALGEDLRRLMRDLLPL